MKRNNIVIITAVTLIFWMCKHEPLLKKQSDSDTPIHNIPCNKDTVYFSRDILPLISSSCAFSECHNAASAKDGIVLNNYNNIMKHGEIKPGDPFDSKLFDVITINDPSKVMPPPPKSKFSSLQIALIQKWIQQGAKNNSCVDCDTSQFKFSSHIQPLLDANCKGCHSGASPSGGVLITNYAEAKTIADNGKLLNTIYWTGPIKMPQSKKLEVCQIQKIENWINNGTKND